MREAGMPPVLARVLASRGIGELPPASGGLAGMLPPSQLKGIDEAARLLADTLMAGGRILVVGDYDADGATSTALCVSLLRAMGAQVDFRVPDRFRFGYGLTPELVDDIAAGAALPALLLTVDNGISAHAGVERARALGVRVVITDHHLPGETLPAADALVNPNQPGCGFASKVMAGVGVAFCVMTALRGELRARGWFGASRAEPNLADALDLVALGTVADVVPLDAHNRLLVGEGLRRMRAGRVRPGIAALIAAGKRSRERLVAADLGFVVAPRLNAAGRLDDMSHGIRCLLAADDAEAARYAEELDALNRARRQIEGDMQQQAQAAMARIALDRVPDGICLYESGWHPGVVGILASRLKDLHHRPVMAFASADAAGGRELRGSGRSIEGVHLRDVIAHIDALHPGLITRFGGHAMAAGLTLDRDRIGDFAALFDAEVRRVLPPEAASPVLWSDGELSLAELDLGLAEALREAVPWGQACQAPLFDGEFDVLQQRVVGEKHLKFTVSTPDAGGRVVDALFFNPDPASCPPAGCRRVHLAFRVDVNEYRGIRSPQLLVEQASAV